MTFCGLRFAVCGLRFAVSHEKPDAKGPYWFTHSSIQEIWAQILYYTEQNSSQMPGAGMGGFGIDRDIRYSIHAELPQLYESRKTHKDESSFFRSCF